MKTFYYVETSGDDYSDTIKMTCGMRREGEERKDLFVIFVNKENQFQIDFRNNNLISKVYNYNGHAEIVIRSEENVTIEFSYRAVSITYVDVEGNIGGEGFMFNLGETIEIETKY